MVSSLMNTFAGLIVYSVAAYYLRNSSNDTLQHTHSTNQGNVTPKVPISMNDNEWLNIVEALKNIAYYLRAHKFNEYDRRYETAANNTPKEYFKWFPRPPLRSLHWEVHKFCEPSFITCVEYLNERIKSTGLRRIDDTAVIIQENQWNLTVHFKQINAVESHCRKMLQADTIIADPFEGPIERFQWRTTASYYMCWYTMQEIPQLQKFKDSCDNFASCLDPQFGVHNLDPRSEDETPFSCAQYSFCPDYCCPYQHLNSMDECWESSDNPCFADNTAGQRICSVNRSQNTNFRDIVLNRWNVTCKCPNSGFEWDSKYGMCVDIDECLGGLHGCDLQREACINLPGSFRCACRWGYAWNFTAKTCLPISALEIIKFANKKTENQMTTRKASSLVKMLFKNLFYKSESKAVNDNFIVIMTSIFFLYGVQE